MPAGVYKESYLAQMAHLRYPIHWAAFALSLMLLVALPFIGGTYVAETAVDAMVFLVAALGLNITTGLAGQISLAQAALMGVGAYTIARIAPLLHFHGSALLLIPLAGVISAVVGVVTGLPSFRLKGYYLAMASIAAQSILEYIFQTVIDPNQGIEIPDSTKTIAGLNFGREPILYYVVLAVTAASVLTAANIGRSSLGRAFKAVRDNDVSASIIGINVTNTKALAFALGSFYAGIAGALYALRNTSVAWDAFMLDTSIELLAIVLVGGAGRIVWGSLLGVLLLHTGWNMIDSLTGGNVVVKYSVFGLLVTLFVVKEPEGLIGVLKRIKEYFRLWPYSY